MKVQGNEFRFFAKQGKNGINHIVKIEANKVLDLYETKVGFISHKSFKDDYFQLNENNYITIERFFGIEERCESLLVHFERNFKGQFEIETKDNETEYYVFLTSKAFEYYKYLTQFIVSARYHADSLLPIWVIEAGDTFGTTELVKRAISEYPENYAGVGYYEEINGYNMLRYLTADGYEEINFQK